MFFFAAAASAEMVDQVIAQIIGLFVIELNDPLFFSLYFGFSFVFIVIAHSIKKKEISME